MLELLPPPKSEEPSQPIDYTKLEAFPRIGCTIASIVLKRTYNIREVAKRFADCDITFATVNLLSAEWATMKASHVRPFKPVPDGQKWDLYDWNPEHFDRIDECLYEMNSRGIVVQWCLEELYRWSIRKTGSGIPDARLGPYAAAWNVNGIDYVGPHYPSKSEVAKKWDATMLAKVLPDDWEQAYIKKVVPHLGLAYNLFLCGNEFPEKSFHQRVVKIVRGEQSDALVSVNRNEETPGQYVNMKIGKEFDFINHHGAKLKKPSDLDVFYPGNYDFPTFRHLLKRPFISQKDKNSVQQGRIMFSSDGAGVQNYNFENLYAFAKEVTGYGASFEHQSVVKLTGDIEELETDFLTKLSKLVH